MKIDVEGLVAVTVFPSSTGGMRRHLAQVKETVDHSIENGLLEAGMRDFYLGWGYADLEGLQLELGLLVSGLPVPLVARDEVRPLRTGPEMTTLREIGDATPWRFYGDAVRVDIEGDGEGAIVLEQSCDGGKTFIPFAQNASGVFFYGSTVRTFALRFPMRLLRLRLIEATSGAFEARLIPA